MVVEVFVVVRVIEVFIAGSDVVLVIADIMGMIMANIMHRRNCIYHSTYYTVELSIYLIHL